MNDVFDPSAPTAERKRAWPAWMVSTAIHTVALILIGLLLGPATRRSADDEIGRTVGLVIAVTRTETSTEFLSEDDPSQEPSESESQSLSEAIPQDSQFEESLVTEVLPTSSPLPLTGALPNLDLTDRLSSGPISFSGDPDADAEFIERERQRAADRDRPPAGPPAHLSLFGSDGATGYRFVFVIDRSKSMGGQGHGALQAARDELYQQLQQLNEVHQFQIVAYHHRTVMLGPRRLMEASKENVELIPEYFQGLASYGGTDHENALDVALGLEPDVIFLLTDGDEPQLSQGQIQELRRKCEGLTKIHCIEFGSGRQGEPSFMKALSQVCGGDYRYVDMSERR